MPLYCYECENCGPIEANVPLARCDEEITCPICGYNDYVAECGDGAVEFSAWLDASWESTYKSNGGSGKNPLKKLPTNVGHIRVN